MEEHRLRERGDSLPRWAILSFSQYHLTYFQAIDKTKSLQPIPTMFPLLDLDDDALAATLGFSDPRTLCAITMACRRLRILADGAWAVLDKRIPEDERAGGSTPREKVLSAFVVHKDKKRMKDFAARGRKAAYLTPEKFKTQNYLLYVHMTNHAEKLVGSFFLNASDEGLRALVDNSESIEVPIEKKQLIGRLKDFVQMYQKPNAAFYLTYTRSAFG